MGCPMSKKSTGKRKRTDNRDWKEYNGWQSQKMRLACLQLKAFADASSIHDWEAKKGRPRIPRRVIVLCLLVKV